MKKFLLCLLVVLWIFTDWGGLSSSPKSHAGGATINVTTTTDELNTDGDCSLREAIQAANTNVMVDQCPAGSNFSPDYVQLVGGMTYTLGISGSIENDNQTGDLDILNNSSGFDLSLQTLSGTATIDGNDLDRVLHVRMDANVQVSDLILTNGTSEIGGIIFNEGALVVNNTDVLNGVSSDAGGGIHHEGTTLTIQNGSNIGMAGNGNTAMYVGGGIGSGAGGATITIIDSSVSYNTTIDESGGGIWLVGNSTLNITDSQILNNTAAYEGGGLVLAFDATVTITNSAVNNNTAQSEGGGILGHEFAGLSIQNSTLLNNSSAESSGAIRINSTNSTTVNGSCIVGNDSGAEQDVWNQTTSVIADFTGNWWGASDGPSGFAVGSGDSVSAYVDTSGFLTSAILGCGTVSNPTSTPTFTASPVTPSSTPVTPTETPITPTSTLITPTNTPITPTSTPITPTDTPITPTLTPTCAIVVVPPTLQSPVHRTHTTDTTPTFTWSQVSGAQSYRLMIYTEDRSFEFKKRRVGQTNTSYTLTNAEALIPAKYLWRVRTQDLGCGTWTKWSTRNTLFID